MTGLRWLAYLPLPLVHASGALLGWLVYLSDRRYARRLRENLRRSAIATAPAVYRRLLRGAIAASGKSFLEAPLLWGRSLSAALKLVRSVQGWEYVEQARAAGKGVILLTPHLGCFEMAGLYCGAQFPFTILYRPPRMASLEPFMRAGRTRGQTVLATTDFAGVKKLLAALKRGEAIGILPDQVPSRGEGVWANFFGQPAYSMTLISRLQEKTGAAVVFLYAQRLAWGRGYTLHCLPELILERDLYAATTQINAAVEHLARLCPQQYLWSYNRYKVPRGVAGPGQN